MKIAVDDSAHGFVHCRINVGCDLVPGKRTEEKHGKSLLAQMPRTDAGDVLVRRRRVGDKCDKPLYSHSSVLTKVPTETRTKTARIPKPDHSIRGLIATRLDIAVFTHKHAISGTPEAVSMYERKVSCNGVRTSASGSETFLNLYIQNCKRSTIPNLIDDVPNVSLPKRVACAQECSNSFSFFPRFAPLPTSPLFLLPAYSCLIS